MVLGSPPPPSRSRNRRGFDVNPLEAGAHFRSPALQGKPSVCTEAPNLGSFYPCFSRRYRKLLILCDLAGCGLRRSTFCPT